MLAGYLWVGVAFRDSPRAGLPGIARPGREAGADRRRAEPAHARASSSTRTTRPTVIGSSVVRALALIGFALGADVPRRRDARPAAGAPAAGRLRRPGRRRAARASRPLLGGGALSGVSDFLDGPRTVDAAREIGDDSLLVTADIINQLGPLALAAGLFLVSLNAMRVGLLTRFLGILGIISGVLTVAAAADAAAGRPVVLAGRVGLLLLGAAPGGAPPAWSTGNAEPWPSQRRARRRRRATTASTAPSQRRRRRRAVPAAARAPVVEEAQAQAPRLGRLDGRFGDRCVQQRVDRDEHAEPPGERPVDTGPSVARPSSSSPARRSSSVIVTAREVMPTGWSGRRRPPSG